MPPQRIYDDELYAHFVTFSCYRSRRLLDVDLARRVVLGVLNSQLSKQGARLVCFVLMPDHVHVIVWFQQPGQLSTFMKQWKQRSSRSIRKHVLPTIPKYETLMEDKVAFWQRRYYAFHIHTRQEIQEKLNYMHLNPVPAGLVERTVDWQWSSARYYEFGCSVGVPISWVE